MSNSVISKQIEKINEIDVDITNPGGKIAVENIIHTDKSRMPEGIYEKIIHNYSHRGGKGVTAEIEFDGHIHTFYYDKLIQDRQKITVAKVEFTSRTGF